MSDDTRRRIARRQRGENSLRDAAILQRTLNRLRKGALVPKGVYRFATHEEADEWMIRQVASTHERVNANESSPSVDR